MAIQSRGRQATPPLARRRRSAVAVLIGLVGATMTPTLAPALDLSNDLLVYREDFQGETSSPTTPEVDAFGLGGLVPFTALMSGLLPVLTGSSAHAEVAPALPGGFGLSVLGNGPPVAISDALGARARFSDWLNPDDFASIASLGLATADLLPTSPSAIDLQAEIRLYGAASEGIGAELHLREFDQSTASDVSSLVAVLPAGMDAELRAGAAFTLDVTVQPMPGGRAARASLSVDGAGEYTSATLPLVTSVSPIVFERLGVGLVGFSNAGTGPNAQLEILEAELYRLFTSSFTVDTTVDLVDPSPGDGTCGTVVGTCSLRAAIMESNALPGPGEIVVPSGLYTLSIAGPDENAAATGDLDITDELVLRGAGRSETIVDAAGLDRVFHVPGTAFDVPVTLRDLTIRGGYAGTAAGATGGGIDNYGQLRLEGCIVRDNQANLAGGIMNRRSLEMDDCLVVSNDALPLGFTNSSAGGIASASTSGGGVDETASIRDSAIVDNTGPVVGGLELGNGSFARIENTTISGNDNRQVSIFNTDVVLQHVTIVNDVGPALSAGSFSGTNTLEIANSAIQGLPACDLHPTLTVVVTRSGHNASSDASCGFSGPGDVEGLPLGLTPLGVLGDSRAHVPTAGSPLVDAADSSLCLVGDQLGTARPIDGDASGTAECDLGSIEFVPEPSLVTLLASGVLGFWRLGRRSPRPAQRAPFQSGPQTWRPSARH